MFLKNPFSTLQVFILLILGPLAMPVTTSGETFLSPFSSNSTRDKNLMKNTFLNKNYTSMNMKLLSSSSVFQRLITTETEEETMSHLIKFLFEGMTGRNVFIFYEYDSPAISASVAMCNERGSEVTLYRCDEALTHLKKIIRAPNKSWSVRNIIVVCSSTNIQRMFHEIRAKVLESAVTYWFVILQEDIIDGIMETIREGTRVTFAMNMGNNTYSLMRSFVNINNDMALHQLGFWSWNAASGVQSILDMPLYRSNYEVYSDFGGRELIATIIDNWPFWNLVYTDDGRVIPVSGVEYETLRIVAERLNFTFRLELTPDQLWGGYFEDGTVTGMVGEVYYHRAHLAMNEVTITEQREKAVDFTFPYYQESVTLVTPAPTKKISAYAVFASFTYKVWLGLFFVMATIGPVVRIFVWFRKTYLGEEIENWDSVSDISFNMFRSLMMQGTKVPTSGSTYRLIFIAWFFFTMLMISLYSDIMIAVLAVPSYEKPIDSLYDLLDAIRHRDYIQILGCGSNNEFIFRNTKTKIYVDIWSYFDHSVSCVKTWDEGMDKVLTGKFALSNNPLSALVRANLRGRDKFYFSKHEYFAHGYGIACPTGSPYRLVFQDVLIEALTFGHVLKFTEEELIKARKTDNHQEEGHAPINISHLQASFYLFLVGNLLAILLLGVEFAAARYSRGKNEAVDLSL